MEIVDEVLVSNQIIENQFVCDLSKCKGACCVEGDAGAPLEEEEVRLLKRDYEKIKPFLSNKGQEVIKNEGISIKGDFDQAETPLINGKECAYLIYSSGIAKCGIETAHQHKAIDWLKPISCHLYPIRVQKLSGTLALNYHSWSICSDACDLGKELKIPVFKFLKNALIRKFGKDWYNKLERLVS